MKIAILDDYQNVVLTVADWSALRARAEIVVFNDHISDIDAIARRLEPFEIVVITRERTPFPRALFDRLPRLKLLVTTGMRNLSIDLAAARARGIVVSGTDNVGFTTAEMTWALILALARNVPREDRALREGKWQVSLGVGLHGKQLGIIGLGKVGAGVAKAGLAFGMDVVAWSQNLTAARCAEQGVRYAARDELLAGADFVSIHLLLSDRTRRLIGGPELRRMKRSAYLINTARAAIVDQAALCEALHAGSIAGAGIDVFDIEPLPADHPLKKAPNTVLTPHLGYVSDTNYQLWYRQCVESIAAWLDGKPLRVLNSEAAKI